MKDPIAHRIKLGDEQAFELLFRKYFNRLSAFANKFLNNPEEAQEVVQDVYIRVWEERKLIDPGKSLKAYMFMIAQNMCINKLRRSKVSSRYLEFYKYVYLDKREFTCEESYLCLELEIQIEEAIQKLPPKCKRVFEMSRRDGLKYKEIADNLNISVRTVEVQISKALQIIRKDLGDILS